MALRFPALLMACWLLAAAMPAQARSFEGVVTHVSDGDTLWVRPSYGGAPVQVRIEGIDAPEICQEFGRQARDAMASRVLHKRVTVKSNARDTYQRALADVTLDGDDLGGWMVARGYAWSYRFHKHRGPFAKQEAQARQARAGLWRGHDPMEPRQFRTRHGSCR